MLEVAIEAATKAGTVLLNGYGRIKEVQSKKQAGLVTNVDIEAEECIIAAIERHYPDHAILSEESRRDEGGAGYRWIIDPLDGTHNFIRGLDCFGICVALEHKGIVVLGVISLPLQSKMFWAERSQGCWCNEQRMRVSSRGELSRATLLYGGSFRYDKSGQTLRALNALAPTVFNLRVLGSSAWHLSLLAAGKADVVVNYMDRPWDFCAGALLVEEAGGQVTDLAGRPWKPQTKGYVASNGLLHEEVLSLLAT